MSITFRPGRLAPVPGKPRLSMSALVAAAPAPPSSVDWHSRVEAWPMYLNDQIGDCTYAMVGHKIQNASTYGDGQTVTVTDDDVLAGYERVSGYRPGRPETDAGAVMQDVYGDWRRNGVGGHKALAFGELKVSDLAGVKSAINVFGAVGLGITVTQQMMDDFDAGKGWGRAGGAHLGGHAVPAVGYDAGGVYVVTWGRVVLMTWGVFRKVVEEAWAAVLPEWVNDSTNLDPLGEELYGLGQELAEMTGGSNPFPQPAPTPTPTPDDPTGCAAQVVAIVEDALGRIKAVLGL